MGVTEITFERSDDGLGLNITRIEKETLLFKNGQQICVVDQPLELDRIEPVVNSKLKRYVYKRIGEENGNNKNN